MHVRLILRDSVEMILPLGSIIHERSGDLSQGSIGHYMPCLVRE
jgi:hypothetical protein